MVLRLGGKCMIHLFGRMHICVDGQLIKALPTKAYFAIALLAETSGGLMRRATLASWLWENCNTANAHSNLRQLLAKIRKIENQFDISLIHSDRKFVCLNPDILIDIKEFCSIDSFKTDDDFSDYVTRYCHLYLQDGHAILGEELVLWKHAHRKKYNERFFRISLAFANGSVSEKSIEPLKKIQKSYPLHEPTCIALLRQFAAQNKTDNIRLVFWDYVQNLKQELEIPPSLSLLNIVVRMLPEEIPRLETEFGYLSHASDPYAQKAEMLPRLLVIPSPNSTTHLDTGDLGLDIANTLVQLGSLNIIFPNPTRLHVPNEATLQTLATDFVLTFKEIPLGINITVTCLYTSEVLHSQFLSFSSLKEPAFLLNYVAVAIQNAINSAILSNASGHNLWTAYRHYLLANETLMFGDLPSIRSARKDLRQSLMLFPEFYLAKQMLAQTYYLEWFLLGRTDTSILVKAQKIAITLIKTDPTNAGGYWQLSTALLYLGHIESALENINKAVAFSPHHADILAHKADVLCHLGRTNEALPLIDRALKINPISPDEYHWIRTGILFLQKKYQFALDETLQSNQLIPFNWRMLAACYAMLGNEEEANLSRFAHLDEYPDFLVSEWEKSFPLTRNIDVEHYAFAMRKAGFH